MKNWGKCDGTLQKAYKIALIFLNGVREKKEGMEVKLNDVYQCFSSAKNILGSHAHKYIPRPHRSDWYAPRYKTPMQVEQHWWKRRKCLKDGQSNFSSC